MFGKPKRAKAVAKPRNQKEADKVNIGVYNKYPQMFKSGWGKVVPKATRTAAINEALKTAGLSTAEINRLRGKR